MQDKLQDQRSVREGEGGGGVHTGAQVEWCVRARVARGERGERGLYRVQH